MSECIELSSDSNDTDLITFPTKKVSCDKKKYEVDDDVEAAVKRYIPENFYTENENSDTEDYIPHNSAKFSCESLSKNENKDNFELELQRLTEKYKLNCPPRAPDQNAKAEKQKEKQKKVEERNRKKREAEQEKCLKKAIAESNKNAKPQECMKFIRVQIDKNLISEDFGTEILSTLEAADVEFTIKDQLFQNTISWFRKLQTHCIDDNGKFVINSEDKDEKEILLVMRCKDFIEHVNNQTLSGHIQSLQSALFNKTIILIIYGLHHYYRILKNRKQNEMRSQLTDENTMKTQNYLDIPQIGKKQIELALMELQIYCTCSYKLVDSPADLGLTIVQFTKAVAEIPFKQQRQENLQQTEWFVAGDNRDTVKVDKNGNGLNRLWNQMLTSFPLARLEIAEAISSHYPTLSALMEAYENCVNPELLLQDIQIRRAAGPLSSSRKIGPELSKKLYNFFNSTDGDSFI